MAEKASALTKKVATGLNAGCFFAVSARMATAVSGAGAPSAPSRTWLLVESSKVRTTGCAPAGMSM